MINKIYFLRGILISLRPDKFRSSSLTIKEIFLLLIRAKQAFSIAKASKDIFSFSSPSTSKIALLKGEIISVEEAQDLNVKISESKDGWCHLYCDVKDSNTGKIEDLKELGFRDIEEDLEDEDNESE